MPGQLEAVLARHHHVEDQQVEVESFELGPGIGRAVGSGDAIAFSHQKPRQEIADAPVVIHDQKVRRVVGKGGGCRVHGRVRSALSRAAAAPGRLAR